MQIMKLATEGVMTNKEFEEYGALVREKIISGLKAHNHQVEVSNAHQGLLVLNGCSISFDFRDWGSIYRWTSVRTAPNDQKCKAFEFSIDFWQFERGCRTRKSVRSRKDGCIDMEKILGLFEEYARQSELKAKSEEVVKNKVEITKQFEESFVVEKGLERTYKTCYVGKMYSDEQGVLDFENGVAKFSINLKDKNKLNKLVDFVRQLNAEEDSDLIIPE